MPIIPVHRPFSDTKSTQILTLLRSREFAPIQRDSSALLTALLTEWPAHNFASTAKGRFRHITQVDADSEFFHIRLAPEKVQLECIADGVADGNTLSLLGSNRWADLHILRLEAERVATRPAF